jgi:HlyD family secretion protein
MGPTGPASPPWWRQRRTLWWLLLAVALAGGAWLRWRPAEVSAVVLRSQPLTRTLQFTARVKTPARVELGSTVTGRVWKVAVNEGDRVQAGAALVMLEADEARANLQQARAALVQAEAKLASQQALSLPSAQSALAQADANLLVAQRDLVRTQELVAQRFYSPQKLDESQRAVDVARAQRDAARAQVQANQRGGERGAAEAQVASARAAVEVAQARLDQTTLRAPAAGRVLLRTVEPGQIVQAGKALLTLGVQGRTELLADVDERFLAQLQVGQTARVLADAYPTQPFSAHVDRLGAAVDAQAGSVEVTFVLDAAPPAFLREDMTLSIEVVTGQRAQARVLPLRALRGAADATQPARGSVLVAEGGRAVLRELTLGLRTLDQAEVLAGLKDGEAVLLDATVQPGQRVRAVLASPATPTATAP